MRSLGEAVEMARGVVVCGRYWVLCGFQVFLVSFRGIFWKKRATRTKKARRYRTKSAMAFVCIGVGLERKKDFGIATQERP